jgi:hypothetical protein
LNTKFRNSLSSADALVSGGPSTVGALALVAEAVPLGLAILEVAPLRAPLEVRGFVVVAILINSQIQGFPSLAALAAFPSIGSMISHFRSVHLVED